jgi:hypothetical protein
VQPLDRVVVASFQRLLLAAALLVVPAQRSVAAIKTDVVELRNGDRITCEIRKLERGKLTVKTDGLGTVAVEWDDVQYLASMANYDIELRSGERVFGSLARGDAGSVVVITSSGRQRLELYDVVRVAPVGGTLWRRLDGKIDAGFSFTQADVQTQWSFNADISYRSRRWFSALSADSALVSSEDEAGQLRNTLSLQSQYFTGMRWSTLGFAQFQQNEELSLDLRAVLGAGVQRVLRQSNRTVFALVGAAALTREQYSGESADVVTEAVAGATWSWFTFDGRSTNLDSSVLTFYGINRTRARLELNSSFKSDIVGDLYWSINVFESYTSDPPEDGKSNDFGVSAAIGWSF